MRSKPKPEHLGAAYAAQFSDWSVARAYYARPPYPSEVFDIIEALMPQRPRTVLELGCGTGDLTFRLARRVDHLDAVEPSTAMLAEAHKRSDAIAASLHWHLATAEEFQITRRYSLVCAGASLHWMDWDIVLPKVAAALGGTGVLALTDRELECPWQREILELIPAYSTNKKFQPYNLVDELTNRGLFREFGRKTTRSIPFSQSIDDYIESFHSSNGFSRDRMDPSAADEFDATARSIVSKRSNDGWIHVTVRGEVVWGAPIKG